MANDERFRGSALHVPFYVAARMQGNHFGGTGAQALHQWFETLLAETLYQLEAQTCNRISLTIREGEEVALSNNGPGLTLDLLRRWQAEAPADFELDPQLAEILKLPRVPTSDVPKPTRQTPLIESLIAASAYSSVCAVEVKRDGGLWRQTFEAGAAQSDLALGRALAPDEATGTILTIRPDFGLFERNSLRYELIAARCFELACFYPGVTFTLTDERSGQTAEFCFAQGLAEYLTYLNRDHTPIHPPLVGSCTWTVTVEQALYPLTMRADVALQWVDGDDMQIEGYVNGERVETALHLELTPAIVASYLNRDWEYFQQLERSRVPLGLIAIIHVRRPDPGYLRASGRDFANADVIGVVTEALFRALSQARLYWGEISAKLRANGAIRDLG